MRESYPVIITKDENYRHQAYIPDFGIAVACTNIPDVLDLARKAIGLMCVDMQNGGETIPYPSDYKETIRKYPDAVVSLVDVDFEESRNEVAAESIVRRVNIPQWLADMADREQIGLSSSIHEALIKRIFGCNVPEPQEEKEMQEEQEPVSDEGSDPSQEV